MNDKNDKPGPVGTKKDDTSNAAAGEGAAFGL
jgi:hypothetical protein